MTNKFLGQGSYGCTFYPGIDNKGYKNNYKNTVTKITLVDFNTKNEINISNKIIKLPKFINRFSPVIRNNYVNFNIVNQSNLDFQENCTNLQEHYYNKSNQGTNIMLLYVYYVPGRSIKKYINSIELPYLYILNYTRSYLYLLSSISILNKINIAHNDLQNSNNILFNTVKNKPIIIDFGLSYNLSKFYTFNKHFDLKYIKKLFFNFRLDHYQYNIDKRFILFMINNKENNYFVYDDTEDNKLKLNDINIFVDDAYDSLNENFEISFFFTDEELTFYKSSSIDYYKKFLDKKLYPDYYHILKELIINNFYFCDIYSLSITYLNIYYSNLKPSVQTDKIDFTQTHFIFIILIQMFKKILIPDPLYRINNKQFIKIFNFIIQYFKKIQLPFDYDLFVKEFTQFLLSIDVQYEYFLSKNYAYIDFQNILTDKNIQFIKKIKL